MENIILEIDDGVTSLVTLANKVQNALGNEPVSSDVRHAIKMFSSSHKNYTTAVKENSANQVAEAAQAICLWSTLLANAVSSSENQEISSLRNELGVNAKKLKKLIENSALSTFPLADNDRLDIANDMQDFQSSKKEMKKVSQNQSTHYEHIKNILTESEKKTVSLKQDIESLEDIYNKKIGSISTEYQEQLKAIHDKNDQLDILLGNAASRVIVTEYADSADQEKIAADWLRGGSLFCMVLIVVVAGYSFIESMQQSFDLSNSLLRLALVFLLSVPAAYLARESTKHRQQQYTHLQTSLDLKAINPYIASLPDEEQHKIKSEIAQRIFAPKDFQSISNESYPINSQEVIMALISKFGNDKDKQPD
ncbi:MULTISPECIES: hypothetical protein [unclassified Psychrobacter]|uniref:hypothetical protein n=1 Tax=unclassified Psychrobacter TaxID=196806 RepID=UPI003FD17FA2